MAFLEKVRILHRQTKYWTYIMKIRISVVYILFMLLCSSVIFAQNAGGSALSAQKHDTSRHSRLSIGGYGEMTYKHSFYSDNVFRYTFSDRYKGSKGHGEVDVPHAVIAMGYDFGHGWTMGTEIEFEHGGTEAAVELETEETGEYEKEIERGGEVALEQFWLQKSWNSHLNLRMGHIVVPIGGTNQKHLPTEYFGVFRPEGENTIIPCTWHETGISLWGHLGQNSQWRYEAQLLPALNSAFFNVNGWAHDASASPYEMRPANHLAMAARMDFSGIANLRIGLSGYIGNAFRNDITVDEGSRYDTIAGHVIIGAADFTYHQGRFVARGNADLGYLQNSRAISRFNKALSNANGSPYPHTNVGELAYAVGVEAGVNVLATTSRHKLYTFIRVDNYDSYIPAEGQTDLEWTGRTSLALGLNYYPLPQIAVKAETGMRVMDRQYNNEPWLALGITWAGMFK